MLCARHRWWYGAVFTRIASADAEMLDTERFGSLFYWIRASELGHRVRVCVYVCCQIYGILSSMNLYLSHSLARTRSFGPGADYNMGYRSDIIINFVRCAAQRDIIMFM